MGRKKKLRKEDIAEDWCFVCKDGGSLRICDYKDCLKAYHPDCVDKDDSLLKTTEKWTCNWHFCIGCDKAPKFYCLCCPLAICGHCLCDAEFAIVRRNKGLCNYCLELALLIEEKKDVDSNGCKIDFSAPDTTEFLFYEYWQIIKEKECLTSEHVIAAHNLLKRGKNYSCASDVDEYDEGGGDDDDDDDDEDEDESQTRKRKKANGKVYVKKKKVKSIRMEFLGWGSKPLLEFLGSIGKDTTKELSQHSVTAIIGKYCKENKLFHPERKRKIICDARLRALLGRKSLSRNTLYKHLTSHLAENLDDSEDEIESSSEGEDEDDLVASKRQQQSSSVRKYRSNEEALDVQQSCFASVVPKNIKLVYLRKSLVEELSKELETFHAKIMGSFVRVKSDPKDYLQKNSHQLVQVTGIRKTLNACSEILLQFSNSIKEVPICRLSDDDFTEEECEDLYQKVKSGLLKRPTIVGLRQKARSLHEEITKHWIARELVLLRKRIDKANEKGWRRELYEYMDRLQLLQKPSEQSRLLNEVPEVIADVVELKPDSEDSTREDVKEHNDDSTELFTRRTKSSSYNLRSDRISRCLNDSPNAADETQAASGDQQYKVGSHNEAADLSPAPVQQSSVGEAPNSVADCLAADDSIDMILTGGDDSKDVAQENGSSSGNDGQGHVSAD